MENLILEFAQFDPVTLAWMAAPKVVSGLRSLWKGAHPSKRVRRAAEKAYRTRLWKRGKEGVYDAGNMREIISKVGRTASGVAEKGKTWIQGLMAKQGLENSAVAGQVGAKYDMDVSKQVSNAARDIAVKNIDTKVKAQDQMGEIGFGDTEFDYKRKLRQRANIDKGLGDLTSAASSYAIGRRAHEPNQPGQDASLGKDIPNFDTHTKEQIWDWLQKHEDPEKALQMLLLMSAVPS